MEFWLIQIFNALSWSMLLFLLSSGLTLIFGLMEIINVAHAAFYMLGGYLAFSLATRYENFLMLMIVGSLGVGITGAFLYRFLVQRVRAQIIGQVLLTMGLVVILGNLTLWIWGGDVLMFSEPVFFKGNIRLGAITIPAYRIFILFFGLAIALALAFVHNKTRLGILIKASVDDEEMAKAMGINVGRLSIGVFSMGALLAGLGGVLGTPIWGVYPGIDGEILTYAFAVVIMGGFGSLMGSFVGSLYVGFIDVFGRAFFPELSTFAIAGSMTVMLAIRPKGLLGR